MSDHEVVVEATNVSKKFRLYKERNHSLKATVMRGKRAVSEDFWALRDVSFEVTQGETFGLIGENGSGKSTMLKCFTKILRPEVGSVSVTGKVSALLELGAGFHPELSGRENVFLNGAILGLSQRELRGRFDEIVEFAGIQRFIDEPVKNYSSGMYVRLGFSVAINVDPDVLLIDEVLAVGDENFQRKCNEKFAELKQSGKTIILVSHALGSVQAMCDRVAWFDGGRLRGIGRPNDVISEYSSAVQVDRTLDEQGHKRWGSGEGKITKAELIGEDGRPTERLRSGSRASLRIHYEMQEVLDRPIFAISIKTVEGFLVSGPTSRDGGCVPEQLRGRGVAEITFDPLALLPGTYDVSVSLQDDRLLHAYDVRQDLIRFDVDRGPLSESGGVVSLGGRWRVLEGREDPRNIVSSRLDSAGVEEATAPADHSI
jgi:ABC-type polysaccharide/polyol phosphate transport system ATPase subunit